VGPLRRQDPPAIAACLAGLYWPQAFCLTAVPEVGLAHFFYGRMTTQDLQQDIQTQLRGLDFELDLVALEQPSKEALRLFIDHPDGVDLGLCERVTRHLNHLRAEYSLEVSSPGPKYSKHKEQAQ
jgi:RimP N-terminal domain